MAAPRPSAGPFTAATMGFLNWMKVLTKVLEVIRQMSEMMTSHIAAMATSPLQWPLPDGLCHLDALLLPVVRQASDEIQEVEATAEDTADGTE